MNRGEHVARPGLLVLPHYSPEHFGSTSALFSLVAAAGCEESAAGFGAIAGDPGGVAWVHDHGLGFGGLRFQLDDGAGRYCFCSPGK